MNTPLRLLIRENTPADAGFMPDASHQRRAPTGGVIGVAAVFQRYDSDLDFLRELAGMMCDMAPGLVDQIRDAIERQDAAGLEQTAHRLKGSLIPFVAPAAIQAAQSLETMGHLHELSRACQEYDLLEADVQRLLVALREIVSLGTAGAEAAR
jgi:HPt (histidine-containing phosphotransfer) domain-containing protein